MSNTKPVIPTGISEITLCLTGFSGYIGRHLLETLRGTGIKPFLIPRPGIELPSMPGVYVAELWNHPEKLAEQLAQLKNVVILNIAGHFVSCHKASDINSLVSGNLVFPLLIFEALKLSNHSRIVNIGTSWEYSDNGRREPTNLYAHLKADNSRILEWYAQESPLRAINLKLNDTYGGNDTRSKLLPLLKNCWLTKKKAQLKSGVQQLNILHIVDVQEGLLAAALHTSDLLPNEVRTAFLLSDETITVDSLIARLQYQIAPGLSVSFEETSDANQKLRGVWEGAPRLPKWNPRISLDEGLRDYFQVN